MAAFEPTGIVLIGGLALGALFGAIAERSGFCVVSGVRDVTEGRTNTGRAGAVAAAVFAAIAGTQAFVVAGLVDPVTFAYLPPTGSAIGVAVGGLVFGLGAVAARGCLGRLTVLAATGNLRALVVILVAGVVAYATMRGLFAPIRASLHGLLPGTWTRIDLAARAAEAAAFAPETVRAAIAVFAAGLTITIAVLVRQRGKVAAGAAIGVLVAGGWFVTAVLGADDFHPVPVTSIAFAAPLGQTLVYAMTATGAKLDFGIVSVLGAVVGAAVSARFAGASKLQGFEGPGQMLRYLGGAVLMGFGAVTALGCSTGQGLTGLSTLAPLSVVAAVAIVAGIRLGLAIEAREARRSAKLVAVGG